ncbi:hypothetical protein MO973_12070 [Paenibacillus sp. TRM 82003]|nr:hypothetical protein [Paenibacillus sp. TRM 82003]
MKITYLLRLFIVFVLSYVIGFSAYVGALWMLWEQAIGGDAEFVFFWSLLAYVPMGITYWLICAAVRRIAAGRERLRFWLYPVCCTLTFLVPTMLILTLFGGGNLWSPEAQLFHILFGATGFTFGIGYAVVEKTSV